MSESARTPQRRARREGGRRIDPVTVVAVVVPLLTLGALATVDPAPTVDELPAVGEAPLTRATSVCPAGLPGSEDVRVASYSATLAGPVEVEKLSERGSGESVPINAGAVVRRTGPQTLVVRAEGEIAPGLLAVRGDDGATMTCAGPRSDVWFTGVGAGPEHRSRLRLVNPDAGPAVADVTVLTADGRVEVKALRGLAVAPRSEHVVDLDQVVPEREDVTLRIQVNRGRLAPTLSDTFQEIGSDVQARSWLEPQVEASTVNDLVGLLPGRGVRELVLANPGEDEVRVAIEVVTESSTFRPTGLDDVRVGPERTTLLDLSEFLASRAASDVLALRLTSATPVTATLRTVRERSVQHVVAAPSLARGAAVLGGGGGSLVLAGAEEETEVTVRQRTAQGRELKVRTVELAPATARRVALSAQARVVEVESADGAVRVALLGEGDLPQVRTLEELALTTKVPSVRPALK